MLVPLEMVIGNVISTRKNFPHMNAIMLQSVISLRSC